MITLTAIGFFLKRMFFLVIDHWKAFAIIFGLIVAVALFNKVCSKPAKLDEKQIQRAEVAVKQRNDAELKQILVDADVKEKNIDANVAFSENETLKAAQESRQKYESMSTDELAAEIERRKNQ